MNDPSPIDDADDDVSRLLRLAGPRPDPPADVAGRVRAGALAAWRDTCRARRRRTWLAGASVGLAAVLAVAFVRIERPPAAPPSEPEPVALVLERVSGGGFASPTPRSGPTLHVGAWIETAPDGRAAWRLRGASVRMDRATRVRVAGASAFWLERGALYVDGASGAAPLEIRTALGQVRELGTQFEVRAAGARLGVRVREGSVLLVRGRERREIGAGRGLEADPQTLVEHALAPHGPEWSWAEDIAPEFPIEGNTLGSLVAWTARETGWRIRFEHAADERRAAGTTLHGSTRGLGPRDALAAVLPTCGLAWRREGGTVWIRSGRGGQR